MPRLIFLPNEERCKEGAVIEAPVGANLIEVAAENGIDIEHACEMSCACTTCHIVVRKGFNSLDDANDTEEDLLDKAWGLEQTSRLSCQAIAIDDDLEVELPRYNINQVSEDH